MILKFNNQFKIKLGSNPTNEADVITTHRDRRDSSPLLKFANVNAVKTTGITLIDIVSPPTANIERDICYLSIINNDASNIEVSIYYFMNAVSFRLFYAIL